MVFYGWHVDRVNGRKPETYMVWLRELDEISAKFLEKTKPCPTNLRNSLPNRLTTYMRVAIITDC